MSRPDHPQLGSTLLFATATGEISGFSECAGHGIEARPSDVVKDPELFAAVVRADVRALRLIVENPDVAGDVMHKAAYPNLSADLWRRVWNRNKRLLFKSPYITQASVEAFVTSGMVPGATDPKAFNYKEILDMRFVDEAVAKVGWKIPA